MFNLCHSSLKKMSAYALKLTGDVLIRYADKITAIKHFNPYTLPMEAFLQYLSSLPHVTAIAIMNYFVLTKSIYTGKQIEAYKSLRAYKFVEAGFVLNVRYAKITENFVIICVFVVVQLNILFYYFIEWLHSKMHHLMR